MSNNHSSLWVERYRRHSLDQYVFNNPVHEKIVNGFLQTKTIPHLLLSGIRGTGKTTLANIIIDGIGIDRSQDLLVINGSDENSVDTVREKIINFVSTYGSSDFKVVLCEEFDYFSQNGQAILRRVLEEREAEARFIFTANYGHKILPEMHSRVQELTFDPPPKAFVMETVLDILLSEAVTFEVADVKQHIEAGYPDIRKIINQMQLYTIDGTLYPINKSASHDFVKTVVSTLEQGSWKELRGAISRSDDIQWDSFYRTVYETVDVVPAFRDDSDKWGEAVVVVAEHLDRHTRSSDPEITAMSMIVRLEQIAGT